MTLWAKSISATLLITAGALSVSGQTNWPQWRGPTADGHSDERSLPLEWTPDSVAWKTPLPGSGQSSPVIWGDHIFLTSSLDQGQERLVFCIRRTDGKVLWKQVAWTGEPEPTHDMNGWASATCTTDGQRVIAFFGKGGLHCFSVDGKHLWSRDLGRFEGPWGTAASPLIVGNMVVQNCDSDADAFLISVDMETGEDVWKTPRPNHRGWSTPVLVRTSTGRVELVVNGHTGVTAYDPESGKQLWVCRCSRGRGSPTVTPADGYLYVLNGLSGGGAYCVEAGGDGDVTESRRRWLARRGGRDLSSPIVIGSTMLAMGLRSSILTAYDVRDGTQLWVKRVGGQVSASPVAFGGRAFFINEAGKILVIDPQSDEKLVATNEIGALPDELFRASITPCRDQLFIRSDRYLYCISSR